MNELSKRTNLITGESVTVFRGHPVHLLRWPELIEAASQAIMTPILKQLLRHPPPFHLHRRKHLLGLIATVMKMHEDEYT